MADDPISKRFDKKLKDKQLTDFGKRTRTTEDLEAEEKLLKEAKKVDPIKGDSAPGRNDPCPCGSGKKYKKCCEAK
ncbi:MAG TPA: SEC-C metal-binding domain-containing protein [Phycisphaerae bacterium]|nr:SEC-C metal-binding domain-containing protein [Phycisphaerae bacterium]